MSLADEVSKLDDLRALGLIDEHELAAAKAMLLDNDGSPIGAPKPASLADQLNALTRQNALLQLDLEWEKAKKRHMVSGGPFGSPYVPKKSHAIWIGVYGFLVGGMFILPRPHSGSDARAAMLVGAVILLLTTVIAISTFKKANAYKVAERCYNEHRAKRLLDETRATEAQ